MNASQLFECGSCGAEIGVGDRFCGDCGTEVDIGSEALRERVHSAEKLIDGPIQSNSGISDKPIADNKSVEPDQLITMSPRSRFSVTNLAGIAIVGIVVIGLFLSRQSDSQKPQTASTNQNPIVQFKAPESIPSSNPLIKKFIDAVHDNYRAAGISQVAPNSFSSASCSGCTPFIIYCISSLTSIQSLKGRKIRISTKESKRLIESIGGKPVVLPFSEIRVAVEVGLIDCSVSGGHIPK